MTAEPLFAVGCCCTGCKVGAKAKGIPTCQRCTGAICDICTSTEGWISVNETCRHDQSDWALELAFIWQRQREAPHADTAKLFAGKLAASVLGDALRVTRGSAVWVADQVVASVFSQLRQEQECAAIRVADRLIPSMLAAGCKKGTAAIAGSTELTDTI